MNSVKTDSENLVLKIMGKTAQGELIPIASDSCLLADTSANQAMQFECSIRRDQHGAFVRHTIGEVLINGSVPKAKQRLAQGDLISIQDNVYQVHQLGFMPAQTADVDETSGNQSVNSRIEELETELSSQAESFDSIQEQFEEFGQKMDSLSSDGGQATEPGSARNDDAVLAAERSLQALHSTPQLPREFEDGTMDTTSQLEQEDVVDDPRTLERLNAMTELRSEPKDLLSEISQASDTQEQSSMATPENNTAQESTTQNADLESESSDNSSLDELLKSLNSRSDEVEPQATTGAESVDSQSEATTESQTAETQDETSANSQQPADASELEDLFASLREKDQKIVGEAEEDQVASQSQPEDSLDDLQRKLNQLQDESTGSVESAELTDSTQGVETPSEKPAELADQILNSEIFENQNSHQSTETEGGSMEPLAAQPAQTPEPVESKSEVEAPQQQESVAELLARMQATPAMDEEAESGQADMLPVETPVSSPVSEPEAAPAAEAKGGSDVQDYMQSLLSRLNGGAAAAPESSIVQAAPETKATESTVEPTVSAEVVEEAPAEPKLNPEDFKPKRVAPENSSNLAAMRELANQSSRNAVQRSERNKKKQEAHALLLAAGGAIAGAFVCTFLSSSPGDLYYILSVLLYLATAVCSGLYAKNNLLPSLGLGGGAKKPVAQSNSPSIGERFAAMFKRKKSAG